MELVRAGSDNPNIKFAKQRKPYNVDNYAHLVGKPIYVAISFPNEALYMYPILDRMNVYPVVIVHHTSFFHFFFI